ncbi:MAG: penicillin-binding transpeptidase domain-containing protein [Nannocystaceae bacterium]
MRALSRFLGCAALLTACTDPPASTPSQPEPREATAPAESPTPAANPWRSRAQAALDEADVPGAVVVVDLASGELVQAERAGRAAHPAAEARSPGSTLKPLLALIGLHERVIAADEILPCTGKRTIDGESFTCFEEHGPLALAEALSTSCNAYSYELATRLGVGRIHDHYVAFGLADDGGVVPEQPTTDSAAALLGTGHGGVAVSPVALARAYAALATGVAPTGHSKRWRYTSEELATVRAAMHGVVQSERGTGSAAAVPGLTILGKTGTTEHGEGDDAQPLALFAGWAPADAPAGVVVVALESPSPGGEVAAPVARRLFAHLLADAERPAPAEPSATPEE